MVIAGKSLCFSQGQRVAAAQHNMCIYMNSRQDFSMSMVVLRNTILGWGLDMLQPTAQRA
jgi:hypothetical protein